MLLLQGLGALDRGLLRKADDMKFQIFKRGRTLLDVVKIWHLQVLPRAWGRIGIRGKQPWGSRVGHMGQRNRLGSTQQDSEFYNFSCQLRNWEVGARTEKKNEWWVRIQA